MTALEQLLRDSASDEPRTSRHCDGQRRLVLARDGEDGADRLRAVLEDAKQLTLDQPVPQLAQRPERKLVLDLVLDPRTAIRLSKGVRMDPAAVWPADLDVAE